LAVAGAVLALLAFGVFFAVGRGGREPTRTDGVQAAAETEIADTAPDVGAVTGTSGAIPALKPPPNTTGTTGVAATTDTTTATTSPPTGTTTGSGSTTTSPPPTTGTGTTTGTTSSPPPTTGTTTTN
jgi:hypothetical protein